MTEVAKDPRHPIQVVSRRTGLTPDVIRVWERRYGAVTPGRSATNRRLYSDEDLARLMLLRRATLAGRAIGNVAHLDSAELASLVEADEAAARNVPSSPRAAETASAQGRLDACMDAVRKVDTARLRSTLQSAALELSTPVLLQQVLVPLMAQIGEEWRRGAIHIHQEHMATSIVRSLLETLRDAHSRNFGGPAVVVGTPPDEPHEIGALMAAVVAAGEGWQVTYLGPNLPLTEVATAARKVGAKVAAVSVVYRENDPVLADDLASMRKLLPQDCVLIVGGRASGDYTETLQEIGALRVADMSEFRMELGRLAGRPQ
jgi:methanogenic corrinoid protein MtbC1